MKQETFQAHINTDKRIAIHVPSEDNTSSIIKIELTDHPISFALDLQSKTMMEMVQRKEFLYTFIQDIIERSETNCEVNLGAFQEYLAWFSDKPNSSD